MNTNDLGLSGDPEPLIESLAREKDGLAAHGHGHGGPIETVRESTYRGHRITVRTSYSITVDDMPVHGHLGVSDDGQVHYHAIPNLGFSSAIELVEKLIDTFPDDFEDPPEGCEEDPEPHEPHEPRQPHDPPDPPDPPPGGHDHAPGHEER
jgi:hypothetical protein